MKHSGQSSTISKLVFFLITFILAACSGESDQTNSSRAGKAGGKGNIKPVPVEIVQPEIGLAASLYVTTATLAPSSDAQINARTSGVIRKILREEGDDVKTGEVLLLLEDDDQKLRLKQAKLVLENADREYQRLSKMKNAGAVSSTEWDAARNAYLSAETELELAQLALSYTRVSAPFDGRVVWREVDLGAYVSSGNLLFRMMSINPLLVRVHVPANRVGQIAAGQQVELKVDSVQQSLTGLVELVSPIVDPATGTVKVTVELERYPEKVRPGDFTEVRMITDKRENALLLPSVAIIEERGEHFVFIDNDSKALRKNVEVGFVIGEKTEVIAGLTPVDRVIVKGQRSLNDGNQLTVIEPNTKSDSLSSVEKPQNTDKSADDFSKKSKPAAKRKGS